jgi:NADH-quinone oxidoreductase subunit D
MEPLDADLDEGELELPAEPMHLNMGPSHPAMHGTIRIVLELSGETIVKADVQIGYLHRGFEKMCERGTWAQVFPYVDRLNYVSPMLNNVGYALAVEKLCGLAVPDRCQWYRMALGELARVSDHLTCTGAMAMELGAFTPFLWFVKAREMVWDILEEETGARLTHSFGRVGGMAKPPTPDFKAMCAAAMSRILQLVEEGEKMLLKNRIFIDRLQNVGPISGAEAIGLGWTGPCLRSTGVAYDIRKTHPYLKYDEVDFDVPVGTRGDTLDRFLVRLGEIRQSKRIIEQSLERMADDGPINCDDPRVVLPEKMDVYTTIEATIQHFKLIMEGAKVPAGEVYSYTEGGNGELGYYLVSDGSGTPYRVRIRPPCFQITGGLHRLIEGRMLSDIVPTFGALNMIGGECDH